uniref:Uncharacterized protein n=1 Tax=Anguilla anguilla TaxID=7936 RepID=A0A0E9SHM5_ANGAN
MTIRVQDSFLLICQCKSPCLLFPDQHSADHALLLLITHLRSTETVGARGVILLN